VHRIRGSRNAFDEEMGSDDGDEILAHLVARERDLLHRISGTRFDGFGERSALLAKLKRVRADIAARRIARHDGAPPAHDTK
jgi:hypothetical protein